MTLYTTFKTNPEVERTGVLLEYGTNSQGLPITIRIARAGGANTAFQKRLEAAVKPYRRQIQADVMDQKQLEKLVRGVFCESVVLGWENVEDKDGKTLPFSAANCEKLFTDLPDLYADVQAQSQSLALFREIAREADAGN
jgi:hypothetical protein